MIRAVQGDVVRVETNLPGVIASQGRAGGDFHEAISVDRWRGGRCRATRCCGDRFNARTRRWGAACENRENNKHQEISDGWNVHSKGPLASKRDCQLYARLKPDFRRVKLT